jgi:hypothetical protein
MNRKQRKRYFVRRLLVGSDTRTHNERKQQNKSTQHTVDERDFSLADRSLLTERDENNVQIVRERLRSLATTVLYGS